MTEKISLQGEIQAWDVGGVNREYIVVTLPYGVASQIYKTNIYSAKSGLGEQRQEIETHVKKLQAAMQAGRFTPTSVAVGTKSSHRKSIQFSELESGEQVRIRMAELTIDLDKSEPLPLIDGGQRFGAMKRMHKSADSEEARKAIEMLPVTAFIYLDGSTRDDFVALNQGKNIDAAHLLSMRVQQKALSAQDMPYFKLAIEVARLLNEDADSPFYKQIRFDSRGIAPLNINTLCGKGKSDIATSLIGLAKIAIDGPHGADGPLDAEALAGVFQTAYMTIKEQAGDLYQPNKVLTPPPDGTKGSATMLIGVATLYTYRLALGDKDEDVVQQELVDAAKESLDDMILGNFSGPYKRECMGAFAKAFFKLCSVEKHHQVPKELVQLLSPSTFGLPKIPKEKKPKAPPKPRQKKGTKKVIKTEVTETITGDVVVDPNVKVQVPVEATKPMSHEERGDLADRLVASYDAGNSVETVIVDEELPSGETETFEPVGADTDEPWEELSA
jgi:hypothetical protein